jgi:hypothetical protein
MKTMKKVVSMMCVLMVASAMLAGVARADGSTDTNPYATLSFNDAYAKFKDKLVNQGRVRLDDTGDEFVSTHDYSYDITDDPNGYFVNIHRIITSRVVDKKNNKYAYTSTDEGTFIVPFDQLSTVVWTTRPDGINETYEVTLKISGGARGIKYTGTHKKIFDNVDLNESGREEHSYSNLGLEVKGTNNEMKDYVALILRMIEAAGGKLQ